LRASIWTPPQALQARQAGAQGIGLVRTEFLLPPGGRTPDREFYIHAFEELCLAASPLPVQVRLLDLAADKLPSWLGGRRPDGGALGMQGARLFALPEVRRVLDAQLAALDLLGARFELGLMLPYLSRADELEQWAAYVRGHLSRPLPVGAMAESPAGALELREWFRVADFVAIGCNDLMQCLFAADRELPALRGYLDPWTPVLYRFLRQVALAARARAGEIQLCGLLAQLPGVLPILLGLGFRSFSVDAGLIPWLGQRVQSIRIAEAEILAASVCAAHRCDEVTALATGRPGTAMTRG
jgi:phosphoenolpyruvate-protein kinase (PTS system EI component)